MWLADSLRDSQGIDELYASRKQNPNSSHRLTHMMLWSPKIEHLSAHVGDTQTNENYFYPLWNAILADAFPEQDFAICPQYPTRPTTSGREGAIDYAVTYLIQDTAHDDCPVFFVEIKPPTDLRYPSARASAAAQMKERFEDLAVDLRIPKLYGISAFGRNIAFFSFDSQSRRIEPNIVANTGAYVRDVAPADHWSSHIMTREGRAEFLRVVGEVKMMSHSLV